MRIEQGTTLAYPKGIFFGKGPVVVKFQDTVDLSGAGLTILAGRNGGGKTTIMRFLSGILPGATWPFPPGIYLPEDQLYADALNYRTTTKCIIERKETRDYALFGAHQLELDIKKPFGQLSRGNRQKFRVLLAMATAEDRRARLLLLDEPLSGLDFEARKSLWRLLDESRQERRLIVSIHPDRMFVQPDDVMVVREGKVTIHTQAEKWDDIEAILESSHQNYQTC